MELIGKIIQVLPERGGTSARTGSEWRVGTYVLETTTDRYPRRMVFEVFGSDKIQQFNIQPGEMVRVSFDIDAREYQGRWYNSIRAWNVDRNTAAPMAQSSVGAPDMTPFGTTPASMSGAVPAEPAPFVPGGADDLPF